MSIFQCTSPQLLYVESGGIFEAKTMLIIITLEEYTTKKALRICMIHNKKHCVG